MHEVKVGQEYQIVGDWNDPARAYVKVSEVGEDLVWTNPSVYDCEGNDRKKLFFPSFWAFKESGEQLGYFLSKDVEEPEEEENNQLSPNVYQFPNGVEVKDISAHLTSFGGQAVQYIARATRLDGVVKGLPIQDLYKAIELLKWEAERLEALQK